MTSNEQFQLAVVDWLEERAGTVLVPTRRLAHALLHRIRQRRRAVGATGWERPRVETLNQFVQRCWRESWPVEGVAATFDGLRLLHRLIDEVPPPDGLRRTVALARQVDDAFGVLTRHGLDPAAKGAHTALSGWRARICGRYAQALERGALVHRAMLPKRVARAIDAGTVAVPAQVLVAGLATASPLEGRLLEALSRRTTVEHLPLPEGDPGELRAVALPQQEQELIWLGQQIVEAAAMGVPLSRLGVVLPDIPGYQQPVERMLRQVLGAPDGPGATYNVALSNSLAGQPLVKAGTLLLDLATRPDREGTVELLLSPYYGAWRENRAQLGRADGIWREAGLGTGSLQRLEQVLVAGDPKLGARLVVDGLPLWEVLAPLGSTDSQTESPRRRTARDWAKVLGHAWKRLGFAVIANEGDRLAARKLFEVVESVAAGLGDLELGAEEFRAWLDEALGNESTTTSGHELAGVQVVGLIESRGLCFDRLFVPGLTSTALPHPVRPLPLLCSDERRRVQGGTAQSERAFSEAAFRSMLACSSSVALCRPLTSGREPLAASPFWPVDTGAGKGVTGKGEERPELRFWERPNPAWLNAAWVKQAWRGLEQARLGGEQAATGERDGLAVGLLPEELAVTAVESLLRCPLAFLVDKLLRLRPLEDPRPGVSGLERGRVIHTVLQRFVESVVGQGLDLGTDGSACAVLLRRIAHEVIDEQAAGSHGQGASLAWEVERRRLVGSRLVGSRLVGSRLVGSRLVGSRLVGRQLGDRQLGARADSDERGLLDHWLVAQQKWWDKGWRFRGAEVGFSGIALAGAPFRIRGSIDRVDEHPEEGLRVWDYKSGAAPSKRDVAQSYVSSQLVQYVAAVKAGAASPTQGGPAEGGPAEAEVAASFWQLNSEKNAGPKLHRTDTAFWDGALVGFKSLLGRVAGEAAEGYYPATPAPGDPNNEATVKRICEYCGAKAFCVAVGGDAGPGGVDALKAHRPEDGE